MISNQDWLNKFTVKCINVDFKNKVQEDEMLYKAIKFSNSSESASCLNALYSLADFTVNITSQLSKKV